MAIKDIIASAKQIRKEADATQAQGQEQKRVIERDNAENATSELKNSLNQYAESILSLLDNAPKFYYSEGCGARCKFTVYHRIVELRIDQAALKYDQPEWVISSEYNDCGVFQGCHSKQSRTYKTEYIRGKNLTSQLSLLILEIVEDHAQLLPQLELAKQKAVKKVELDRQSEEYEALLVDAAKQSAEQIEKLVPELQIFSWTWSKDGVIPLYKIRWCTGAYRESEYDDSYDFEYESGWALSGASDKEGYFTLLPEGRKKAQKIKPGHLSEIECVQISDLSDVPATLTEKVNHEIEVVEVVRSKSWLVIVLPHLLPVTPECVSVSITTKMHTLELGVQPIIEIRRAIDAATYEPVSYAIKPAPF